MTDDTRRIMDAVVLVVSGVLGDDHELARALRDSANYEDPSGFLIGYRCGYADGYLAEANGR